MAMLLDEKDLARLGALTLTSRRVRGESNVLGARSIRSIMLDQVSFCGVESRSYPLFLGLAVLAALVGVAGLTENSEDARLLTLAGLAVAVVLVLLYFATRQSFVTVASSGGRAQTRAARLKHDAVTEFIDAVEAARLGSP